MLSLALAVVAITSPHVSESDIYPCRLSTVQAVAVCLELMDARERDYLLAAPEAECADLATIRARYVDLADAPAACDAKRWGDREYLSECCQFNREYRSWLVDRYGLTREWDIQEAIAEADQLYEVYDTARDACCDYYYMRVRREYLAKLRELIGAEAYYAGRLPPCVPIWRFNR